MCSLSPSRVSHIESLALRIVTGNWLEPCEFWFFRWLGVAQLTTIRVDMKHVSSFFLLERLAKSSAHCDRLSENEITFGRKMNRMHLAVAKHLMGSSRNEIYDFKVQIAAERMRKRDENRSGKKMKTHIKRKFPLATSFSSQAISSLHEQWGKFILALIDKLTRKLLLQTKKNRREHMCSSLAEKQKTNAVESSSFEPKHQRNDFFYSMHLNFARHKPSRAGRSSIML